VVLLRKTGSLRVMTHVSLAITTPVLTARDPACSFARHETNRGVDLGW
jgi:hypothetical protein